MYSNNKLKIIFYFLFTISVYSQNSSVSKIDSLGIYQLSDIVVTATRTKSSSLEVASSITVIDKEEIERKKKINVVDLLKDEYGISVTQQGGPGKLASVFMRGANSNHTLVLIDGIEMNLPNDPGNTFDFASLPVDNIERIEILRGPQSTLYGSDALAGVINIITKKGNGSAKFFITTEAGSYNTYRAALGVNGSLGSLGYSLAASRLKTDGFSSAGKNYGNTEKDGTSNYNLTSKLDFQLAKNLSLDLTFRFTSANSDFDQFGGMFGDDPTYIYELEELAARAQINNTLLNEKWEQSLGVSFFRNIRKYNFDYSEYNWAASRSRYDGNKIKADWQNNFLLSDASTLTVGFEAEREEANLEYNYYSEYFFQYAFPSKSLNTAGIYVQNQLRLGDSFFSAIGLRYDSHQKFGNAVTYKIAPAYIFASSGTKIKATLGTGFKAPSLFNIFDQTFGNENLKPEKSTGWDFGIEQYLLNYNAMLGVTYFSSRFEDLIGFDLNFKSININRAESKGVELYGFIKVSESIQFKANYTYTDSRDKSPNLPESNSSLLRRPKNKTALSLDYKFINDGSANVELIYSGEREDLDFSYFPAQRLKLKEYFLLNAAVSYKLFKSIELFGRVENLLNYDYEEVYGYATAGLSGYIGINFTLN